MIVREAKRIARQWAIEYAAQMPVKGIYLSGSILYAGEEDQQPETSDVDILVIPAGGDAPEKLGKFLYQGVLLEVSFINWEAIGSPQVLLSTYELAGSFARPGAILVDPDGRLARLLAAVMPEFAEGRWTRARYQAAIRKADRGLDGYALAASLSDRVNSWLFPAGILTHALLVAALKNPTVRLRYVAVREVLRQLGREDFYEELLGLLGCEAMRPEQAIRHLDELAITFDLAAKVAKTPFPYSQDITPFSRPVVIDGSRALIERGDHREAIFWIAATFARCHQIFTADAPLLAVNRISSFLTLLGDMGARRSEEMMGRCEAVRRFFPRVEEMAEEIIEWRFGISDSESVEEPGL